MENEKTINTNMLIELPELIKAKFLEDAEGAFKAVSEKVLKNKGETFKDGFIKSYMSLKSQNYFNVERSLDTQSQLIQGFEEREFELLEQINQLKKQIK
jgi:CHASE3 domain sensor protein